MEFLAIDLEKGDGPNVTQSENSASQTERVRHPDQRPREARYLFKTDRGA
jgi:hypothetical protein